VGQRRGDGVSAEHELEAELLIGEEDRRRKNVDSGKVAILYCTDSMACFHDKWSGTSKERRRWAVDVLSKDRALGAKLIFIEIVVDRADILESNLRAKLRSEDEDKPGKAEAENGDPLPPQALRDFNARVTKYRRMFVTLQEDGSEDDLSYIKLINYGEKVITNRMHGYLRMRIAQFLTVIHPTPHTIYLTRHGQSEYNVAGKIGGNPPLSAAGAQFALRLGTWVPENIFVQNDRGQRRLAKCRLWTSSLQRTILTAAHIPHPIISAVDFGRPISGENSSGDISSTDAPAATPFAPFLSKSTADGSLPGGNYEASEQPWEQMSPRVYRNLDEIFAGEYEGMTYEEIKAKHHDEASLRAMDKIGYRYPRGESYFDILARLDPLVHELESYHEPLLLVSHQAVLRLLYAYLMGVPRSKAPKIDIPLHTVMKITYDGWNPPHEERFKLGPFQLGPDGQEQL